MGHRNVQGEVPEEERRGTGAAAAGCDYVLCRLIPNVTGKEFWRELHYYSELSSIGL